MATSSSAPCSSASAETDMTCAMYGMPVFLRNWSPWIAQASANAVAKRRVSGGAEVSRSGTATLSVIARMARALLSGASTSGRVLGGILHLCEAPTPCGPTGGSSDWWHRVCRLHRARGRARAEHCVLVHQCSCAGADRDRRRRDRASPSRPARASGSRRRSSRRSAGGVRAVRGRHTTRAGAGTATEAAADGACRHIQGRVARPPGEGRDTCDVLRRPWAHA